MAGFKKLDKTGNADAGRQTAKISAMLQQVLDALGLSNPNETQTAAATSGAATLNTVKGVITSEALTTAAAAVYTLTLTDSKIAAASVVMASLANGTNTQGIPVIEKVTPAAGSVVITVRNNHASQALNGTLKVAFAVQ